MSRWRSFGLLGGFVVAMLGFGAWYSYEQLHAEPEIPVKATLTVYTDLPNNVTSFLADEYLNEAQVRINVMPLTGEQMAKRLDSNYLDQRGDIVLTSKDNLMLGAKSDHLLGMYSERMDLIAPTFKDSEGRWVGLWYDPVVFTQNTSYYNRLGQFITTWGTLAKEGPWTVVMTDFMTSESAANILHSFVEIHGEAATVAYMKSLGTHVTQYAKYLDTPIRLASLNEANIGIGNYSDGSFYVRQGYPVKVIFPLDGTPYYLTGAGILKSSNQYAESVQFINWLLSAKTAQEMQKAGYSYFFTNPEVKDPVDSLGHPLVLLETQGGYTVEGKKSLLEIWLKQVRFGQ